MPLYTVLYQAPCAACKLCRFVYLGRGAAFVGICPICDLVYVIAYGRQLTQQGGICIRWTRTELRAYNKLADDSACAETAFSAMLGESGVFRIIQPQANEMFPLSYIFPPSEKILLTMRRITSRGFRGFAA